MEPDSYRALDAGTVPNRLCQSVYAEVSRVYAQELGPEGVKVGQTIYSFRKECRERGAEGEIQMA